MHRYEHGFHARHGPPDEHALFCYQARKWIGTFAAVDTLVFAGGIGENAPAIRARICEGLAFLGIELDSRRNDVGEGLVPSDASRAGVRVIRADEEVMIARAVGEASTASAVIGVTHFGRKP